MNHQKTQMHYSRRMLGAVLANRKIAVCVGIAMLLTACGSSKPGASDIEPYLVDNFGKCPLWTLQGVKKTDGVELENAYRLDYSAELTLKDSPENTVKVFLVHEHDPLYTPCTDSITAMVYQMASNGQKTIAKNYVLSGYAGFVKFEKGWRIATGIENTFTPK